MIHLALTDYLRLMVFRSSAGIVNLSVLERAPEPERWRTRVFVVGCAQAMQLSREEDGTYLVALGSACVALFRRTDVDELASFLGLEAPPEYPA